MRSSWRSKLNSIKCAPEYAVLAHDLIDKIKFYAKDKDGNMMLKVPVNKL